MVVAHKVRGQIQYLWLGDERENVRWRDGENGGRDEEGGTVRGRRAWHARKITSQDTKMSSWSFWTHIHVGKDGLTFSPHRPSCQLFWNPTGTSGRCMGMLEPLGMNNFCNLGGKREPAVSLHVHTGAAVMFYSDCQLCFVSAASQLSLDHTISCVVNIGKDEACGWRS